MAVESKTLSVAFLLLVVLVVILAVLFSYTSTTATTASCDSSKNLNGSQFLSSTY